MAAEWGDDILDSRDIIERMTELADREDSADDPLDEDEIQELVTWREVAAQGESLSDWQYGETLIHDRYFEDYARELADDIGAIDRNAGWPLTYIDWTAAAEALQQDYTVIEVDGHTYWARG